MWHYYMCRKATVGGNPKMAWARANVLVTNLAGGALSATNPGIHGDLGAGFCTGVWPSAFDRACYFVAKRERQSASRADIESFVAAKRKVAILHVQVGMADAAPLDLHQDLGSSRLWSLYRGFAQGCAVSGQGLAVHLHTR